MNRFLAVVTVAERQCMPEGLSMSVDGARMRIIHPSGSRQEWLRGGSE